MKAKSFELVRYDADDGKVFDWAEPHYQEILIDENKPELGTKQGEQEHLYAKTIFIGSNDTIDNYIEVDEVI
nr:hypothetical protein JMPHXYHW_JMPHXYHW_CDS_0034 [uncultured phage]